MAYKWAKIFRIAMRKSQLLFNHLCMCYIFLKHHDLFLLFTEHTGNCAEISLLIETALLLQDNFCSVCLKNKNFFNFPSVFISGKLFKFSNRL